MTLQDLIDYLRLQIHIQDPGGTITEDNEDYLALTDENLTLFLNVARSKHFSEYSLHDLPETAVYPVVLLAKRELILSLAVKVAPSYDMTADNNNVLREHQMFIAYWKLIQILDEQYEKWLESCDVMGIGVLNTFDALVNTRYYSLRNYEKGLPPSLTVRLHEVSSDRVSVSWMPANVNRLSRYEVRVHVEPTWFREAQSRDEIFHPEARVVALIDDAHVRMCQVTGLVPNTPYYLSVAVIERNGLFGVKEISFTTESG